MSTKHADEYDVVVVGSGAGGMAAALAASIRGLSVALVEKADYYGGTTAYSGGGIWIPCNPYQARAGVEDDLDRARRYLSATVGDRVPASRRERYLVEGPRMIQEFDQRTRWVRWRYLQGYPDYFPEADGGLVQGRSLEPPIVDGRKLGSMRPQLQPPLLDLKGLAITASDVHDLAMIGRTWAGKITGAKLVGRLIASKVTGAEHLAIGQALVARLRLALADRNVAVLLSTALSELSVGREGGVRRVTGIRCVRNGESVTLTAKRGVILAAGGFGHSQEMREQYLLKPTDSGWTQSSPGQVGDAIKAGMAIGAEVDLMDRVWGSPSAMLPIPGSPPLHILPLVERAAPGTLLVNGAGERFANESLPYDALYDAMYANNRPDAGTIPAWFVFDQRAKDRYLMFTTLPRQKFPKEWESNGFLKRAQSIAELAAQIGVPAAQLGRTISRFNGLAENGHDDDFHRGESAYDHYYGDPRMPNPNLAPLDKPPYYAIALYPCDLSTKGGLMVDDDARVLDKDRRPIQGLYATGNCSASVMGTTYVGPGATLGPAMVFGYTAAKHIAAASDVGSSDRPTASSVG
ncbi:FAD-dependent oxidoreductase [Rhodococcus sp. ACS1]|uniref:FAD-dependent oxidoreductase n=1 Tax=Rhodococcus sp. ACS1 TaxID=2028570 RepID=UPI001C530122|nr:FAD-dependent oxidoreductase [Rhodococcus sp. ACS1]